MWPINSVYGMVTTLAFNDAGTVGTKCTQTSLLLSGNDWWSWQGWRWRDKPRRIPSDHEENKPILS